MHKLHHLLLNFFVAHIMIGLPDETFYDLKNRLIQICYYNTTTFNICKELFIAKFDKLPSISFNSKY